MKFELDREIKKLVDEYVLIIHNANVELELDKKFKKLVMNMHQLFITQTQR